MTEQGGEKNAMRRLAWHPEGTQTRCNPRNHREFRLVQRDLNGAPDGTATFLAGAQWLVQPWLNGDRILNTLAIRQHSTRSDRSASTR